MENTVEDFWSLLEQVVDKESYREVRDKVEADGAHTQPEHILDLLNQEGLKARGVSAGSAEVVLSALSALMPEENGPESVKEDGQGGREDAPVTPMVLGQNNNEPEPLSGTAPGHGMRTASKRPRQEEGPGGSAARARQTPQMAPMDLSNEQTGLGDIGPVEGEEEDPVFPDKGAVWEPRARLGLENILRLLKFNDLKRIVDDNDWRPTAFYKYTVYDRDTGERIVKNRNVPYIAGKVTKQVFDGQLAPGQSEAGGTTWEGINEFLDDFVPAKFITMYLENLLKKEFAALPNIQDERKLLWRLWCHPAPPKDNDRVLLGRITCPCKHIGETLKREWALRLSDADFNGPAYIGVAMLVAALDGYLDPDMPEPERPALKEEQEGSCCVVKNEDGSATVVSKIAADLEFKQSPTIEYDQVLRYIAQLTGRRGNNIKPMCTFDLDKMELYIDVFVDMKDKGQAFISAAYVRNDRNVPQRLILIWLEMIIQAFDHLRQNRDVENAMEEMNEKWDLSCDALEGREVALELPVDQPVNIKMLDKMVSIVEDYDRPMLEGLDAWCEENIDLPLKPYQKRALSFMLNEEHAQGGTARHFWVKIPLPAGQEHTECWISPSLFQLFISKSPIATRNAIGTNGGGGWQALEMGMGKTAVILAGIAHNPPPQNWRRERTWTPYTKDDYMLTVTENMPHGGTLVVVPATLVRQWENEIRKTLSADLLEQITVLNWTQGERTHDCKEIAEYDIVITTPQVVTKSSALKAIFWHRIVIDEAQLNAGSLMSRDCMFSTHRWIVTGTPVNAAPESMGPSLEFLRLGGYGAAQQFAPASLTTAMRSMMLRYTKNGMIENQKNLDLLPVRERDVPCELVEDDLEWYGQLASATYLKFKQTVEKALRKLGHQSAMEDILEDRTIVDALMESRELKRKAILTLLNRSRSQIGGGTSHATDEREYNEATGRYEFKKRFFISKARAVANDIRNVLHEEDAEAKILVFSEYTQNLKSISSLLDSYGIGYSTLIGSTSARKRGDEIDQFVSDPMKQVFLLGAKSGGVGINLTAANYVYLCEPLMNPSLESQAIGRSARIGQDKQVHVTRMYLQDTVEERLKHFLSIRHGLFENTESTAMQANAEAMEVSNILDLANVNELLFFDDEDE